MAEAFVGTALKVQADVAQLIRFGIGLDSIQKQINFTKINAVNSLAYKLRLEHQKFMKTIFHNPIDYTLRGIEYYKARPGDENPSANVGFITSGFSGRVPAGKYLQAQAFGGPRARKSTEKKLLAGSLNGSERIAASGTYIIPRRSERDIYGNISGGRLNKIYADLVRGRSGSSNKAERFFVMRTKKYAAIWARRREGTNVILTKSGKIKELKRTRYRGTKSYILPILYLKRTSPNYKARYPFYEFSEKYWNDNIEKEFNTQWMNTLSTARW